MKIVVAALTLALTADPWLDCQISLSNGMMASK
jgi:hypothetical protein